MDSTDDDAMEPVVNKRPRSKFSPADPCVQKNRKVNNECIVTTNRFSPLSQDEPENETEVEKIPPIFVKTDFDYTIVTNFINNAIGSESYLLSTSTSGIKVMCTSSTKYRLLVQSLKTGNWEYHTS
jgi:hypothetical protein